MKVAHFAPMAPHQCGLYHTAKDLVMAERSVGLDAQLIDPDRSVVCRDGSFTSAEHKWAYDADVLVRHTHIPVKIHNSGLPVIMALHGRPESSWRLEKQGNAVIPGLANKATDQRYKAFVTFWPEYLDFWKNLVSNVYYVPATVDLDAFRPVAGKKAGKNLLVCDIWREDVTPFNPMLAALEWARQHKAKVHIVAVPNSESLLRVIHPYRDVVGTIYGTTKHIDRLYARSDILVTPHVIATRSIREAMACGLKVVAGQGCRYTPFTANPMDLPGVYEALDQAVTSTMAPRAVRLLAERAFGFENAGKAMKQLCEGVVHRPSKRRKVFVDIGAHLGETVRRFYREQPDAHQYEIYCFEPDPATFRKLDETVGHIHNVTLVNAVMGVQDGLVSFFPGSVNQNEGGTSVTGKQTGGVKYDRPIQVESVDLVRWLEDNGGDTTVVKMNIEGGEYDLMEYLLQRNATDKIDQLYVQLHAPKFSHGKQRQRFQAIEGRFWNEAQCQTFFTNKGLHAFGTI